VVVLHIKNPLPEQVTEWHPVAFPQAGTVTSFGRGGGDVRLLDFVNVRQVTDVSALDFSVDFRGEHAAVMRTEEHKRTNRLRSDGGELIGAGATGRVVVDGLLRLKFDGVLIALQNFPEVTPADAAPRSEADSARAADPTGDLLPPAPSAGDVHREAEGLQRAILHKKLQLLRAEVKGEKNFTRLTELQRLIEQLVQHLDETPASRKRAATTDVEEEEKPRGAPAKKRARIPSNEYFHQDFKPRLQKTQRALKIIERFRTKNTTRLSKKDQAKKKEAEVQITGAHKTKCWFAQQDKCTDPKCQFKPCFYDSPRAADSTRSESNARPLAGAVRRFQPRKFAFIRLDNDEELYCKWQEISSCGRIEIGMRVLVGSVTASSGKLREALSVRKE
jgi:hypothetical protein